MTRPENGSSCRDACAAAARRTPLSRAQALSGRPDQRRAVLEECLRLLESAPGPGTLVRSTIPY